MTVTIGDALERAAIIVENEAYTHLGRDYDWRRDAKMLTVDSNAFTPRQAARIIQRDPQYVTRYIKDYIDADKPKKRATTGVSGNIDTNSFRNILALRDVVSVNRLPGRRLDSRQKRAVLDLIAAGNGAAVLSHLTDIPVHIIRRLVYAAK